MFRSRSWADAEVPLLTPAADRGQNAANSNFSSRTNSPVKEDSASDTSIPPTRKISKSFSMNPITFTMLNKTSSLQGQESSSRIIGGGNALIITSASSKTKNHNQQAPSPMHLLRPVRRSDGSFSLYDQRHVDATQTFAGKEMDAKKLLFLRGKKLIILDLLIIGLLASLIVFPKTVGVQFYQVYCGLPILGLPLSIAVWNNADLQEELAKEKGNLLDEKKQRELVESYSAQPGGSSAIGPPTASPAPGGASSASRRILLEQSTRSAAPDAAKEIEYLFGIRSTSTKSSVKWSSRQPIRAAAWRAVELSSYLPKQLLGEPEEVAKQATKPMGEGAELDVPTAAERAVSDDDNITLAAEETAPEHQRQLDETSTKDHPPSSQEILVPECLISDNDYWWPLFLASIILWRFFVRLRVSSKLEKLRSFRTASSLSFSGASGSGTTSVAKRLEKQFSASVIEERRSKTQQSKYSFITSSPSLCDVAWYLVSGCGMFGWIWRRVFGGNGDENATTSTTAPLQTGGPQRGSNTGGAPGTRVEAASNVLLQHSSMSDEKKLKPQLTTPIQQLEKSPDHKPPNWRDESPSQLESAATRTLLTDTNLALVEQEQQNRQNVATRTSSNSFAWPYGASAPMRVADGEADLVIFGSNHGLAVSALDVLDVIEQLQPDIIAVELDVKRYLGLSTQADMQDVVEKRELKLNANSTTSAALPAAAAAPMQTSVAAAPKDFYTSSAGSTGAAASQEHAQNHQLLTDRVQFEQLEDGSGTARRFVMNLPVAEWNLLLPKETAFDTKPAKLTFWPPELEQALQQWGADEGQRNMPFYRSTYASSVSYFDRPVERTARVLTTLANSFVVAFPGSKLHPRLVVHSLESAGAKGVLLLQCEEDTDSGCNSLEQQKRNKVLDFSPIPKAKVDHGTTLSTAEPGPQSQNRPAQPNLDTDFVFASFPKPLPRKRSDVVHDLLFCKSTAWRTENPEIPCFSLPDSQLLLQIANNTKFDLSAVKMVNLKPETTTSGTLPKTSWDVVNIKQYQKEKQKRQQRAKENRKRQLAFAIALWPASVLYFVADLFGIRAGQEFLNAGRVAELLKRPLLLVDSSDEVLGTNFITRFLKAPLQNVFYALLFWLAVPRWLFQYCLYPTYSVDMYGLLLTTLGRAPLLACLALVVACQFVSWVISILAFAIYNYVLLSLMSDSGSSSAKTRKAAMSTGSPNGELPDQTTSAPSLSDSAEEGPLQNFFNTLLSADVMVTLFLFLVIPSYVHIMLTQRNQFMCYNVLRYLEETRFAPTTISDEESASSTTDGAPEAVTDLEIGLNAAPKRRLVLVCVGAAHGPGMIDLFQSEKSFRKAVAKQGGGRGMASNRRPHAVTLTGSGVMNAAASESHSQQVLERPSLGPVFSATSTRIFGGGGPEDVTTISTRSGTAGGGGSSTADYYRLVNSPRAS
ncbi:unnamed protein product [Amoebophrya sp. A120]|nr:unnamed protein product [Amoebophrya sp. A120]|eukprot:GSA120T00008032001.1